MADVSGSAPPPPEFMALIEHFAGGLVMPWTAPEHLGSICALAPFDGFGVIVAVLISIMWIYCWVKMAGFVRGELTERLRRRNEPDVAPALGEVEASKDEAELPYPLMRSCDLCGEGVERGTSEHIECRMKADQDEREALCDRVYAWAAAASVDELARVLAVSGHRDVAIYRHILDPSDESRDRLLGPSLGGRSSDDVRLARALMAPRIIRREVLVACVDDYVETHSLSDLRDLAARVAPSRT